MKGPSQAAILAALPHPAAVLDSSGSIVVAHPGLSKLATVETSLDGEPFFELLHHLSGISGAAISFARAIPYDELHDSFPLTHVDPRTDLPNRYRLELHSFQFEGEAFVLAQFIPVSGADHMEQQIHALREQLSEIRRVKHDISNALMSCLGQAGLMTDQPDVPEAVQNRLRQLLDKAREIGDLVQGLGQIASGKQD